MLSIEATLFWFLFGVGLLVLEVLTPGFFLIFFGLGAWVVALLAVFYPLEQSLQWLIFSLVSVVNLVLFRRKFKDFILNRKNRPESMVDPVAAEQYIGREVLVIQEIKPGQSGLVELNGTNWQACTEGDLALAVGMRAWVVSRHGLTLVLTTTRP